MNDAASNPNAGPALHRRKRRRSPSVWLAVVLWAVLMVPLLNWGLPSRTDDDLLFGGDPAWPAERYHLADILEERARRQAGADTDLDPVEQPDQVTLLNPDDDARAGIYLRYRLYSRQPDEMITFMALQRMQPRQLDFDPRLYQYGGGYIYLIAAALASSAVLGIVDLTGDAGVYLEQPELFARFYVVARFVTLVFGALLLAAVWKLACRAAGRTAGWFALLCVACTPVFITGVLEAKPHVPSACMVLWATLSALDYQAHRRRRDLLRMGVQAGYAFGLVLTGVVAAAIWPVLLATGWRSTRLSPAARKRLLLHLLGAAGLAAAVYLLTNPYLPYNLLFDRQSLASNFNNSTAMYADQMRQAAAGALRVGELLLESCGWGVLLAGLVGLAVLLRARPRETALAAVSGVAALLMCVLLGAGKPAEFARFLILPVALLCVALACLLASLARRRRLAALAFGAVVLLFMRTPAYVGAFVTDAGGARETRHLAARYLHQHAGPSDAIGVLQRPAPYAVPPLDIIHRDVLWIPPVRPAALVEDELPPWLVFTADDQAVHAREWWTSHYRLAARFPPAGTRLTPIAWADKPVFVYRGDVRAGRGEPSRAPPAPPPVRPAAP
nr:hypothetical protein fc107 [uncultured bacterium]